MKKEKLNIKNSFGFFIGWYRYYLYYSEVLYGYDLSWLIRPHIKEQIDVRIASIKDKCYLRGSCNKCGCQVTALQMANYNCKGYCYPSMLSKSSWNVLKNILETTFSLAFVKETYKNTNIRVTWAFNGTRFIKKNYEELSEKQD